RVLVIVSVCLSSNLFVSFFFFFFFQAEDGIRDLIVTGVQTCALPICPRSAAVTSPVPAWQPPARSTPPGKRASSASADSPATTRSEERRVGKECRSRWSADL